MALIWNFEMCRKISEPHDSACFWGSGSEDGLPEGEKLACPWLWSSFRPKADCPWWLAFLDRAPPLRPQALLPLSVECPLSSLGLSSASLLYPARKWASLVCVSMSLVSTAMFSNRNLGPTRSAQAVALNLRLKCWILHHRWLRQEAKELSSTPCALWHTFFAFAHAISLDLLTPLFSAQRDASHNQEQAYAKSQNCLPDLIYCQILKPIS